MANARKMKSNESLRDSLLVWWCGVALCVVVLASVWNMTCGWNVQDPAFPFLVLSILGISAASASSIRVLRSQNTVPLTGARAFLIRLLHISMAIVLVLAVVRVMFFASYTIPELPGDIMVADPEPRHLLPSRQLSPILVPIILFVVLNQWSCSDWNLIDSERFRSVRKTLICLLVRMGFSDLAAALTRSLGWNDGHSIEMGAEQRTPD